MKKFNIKRDPLAALAVLAAMCIWPAHFAPLAWGFAALCAITWISRIAAGWRLLRAPAPAKEALHE